MLKTINKIFIQTHVYHYSVVGRIVFHADGQTHESNLYSMQEINNILTLWRMNELRGSFAIGYKLADNAIIEMM